MSPPPRLRHRGPTGRFYRGLTIHAAPGTHEHAARLCAHVLPAGVRLLEIGSGSGALGLRLSDLGFDVTLTDLAPSAGGPASEQLDITNTVDTAQFARAFDAIVMVETLEHIENPRQALRNLLTVVRPGGALILSTPYVDHPHSRLKFAINGSFFLFGETNYWRTGHISPLPSWLLRQHLVATGWNVRHMEAAAQFEFARFRRFVLCLERAMFSLIPRDVPIASGDGAILFAVATRP